MHDIGKLILFNTGGDDYLQIIADHPDGNSVEQELASFGVCHPSLGRHCGMQWGLPHSINNAIGKHHEPISAELPPLAHVVTTANYFARKWQIGFTPAEVLEHHAETESEFDDATQADAREVCGEQFARAARGLFELMMRHWSFQRLTTNLVAAILILGTIGFVVVEGWSVSDAVYMTLITLSTVGYTEVQELSPNGQLFTSVLVILSFILVTCWTAGFTSTLVSGELSGRFQLQQEKRMIQRMKGHTIVCGGGIAAVTILRRLTQAGKDVVVVTDQASEIDLIRRTHPDTPIVRENPSSELALIDANALAASYLVAATDSDHDNLLITISGHGLGTGIRVISFSQSTELASRMFKVGADEVICPLVSGGERIAELITNPDSKHSPEPSTVGSI